MSSSIPETRMPSNQFRMNVQAQWGAYPPINLSKQVTVRPLSHSIFDACWIQAIWHQLKALYGLCRRRGSEPKRLRQRLLSMQPMPQRDKKRVSSTITVHKLGRCSR